MLSTRLENLVETACRQLEADRTVAEVERIEALLADLLGDVRALERAVVRPRHAAPSEQLAVALEAIGYARRGGFLDRATAAEAMLYLSSVAKLISLWEGQPLRPAHSAEIVDLADARARRTAAAVMADPDTSGGGSAA